MAFALGRLVGSFESGFDSGDAGCTLEASGADREQLRQTVTRKYHSLRDAAGEIAVAVEVAAGKP